MKKQVKRLKLEKETVRILGTGELDRIVGGETRYPPCNFISDSCPAWTCLSCFCIPE